MSDYLWDRSGEPDPEVQRLENLLARYRHARPAPEFPEQVIPFPAPRRRWVLAMAAAAVLALGAAGVWLATRPQERGWEVARLEGMPKVGSGTVGGSGRLGIGEWLETDAASRAKMYVGVIGQVDVGPNTRLRLLRSRLTEHRLNLARGSIQATISAPPRLFFVETASAVAVDLGCMYKLEVDESGAGLLHVTAGWVALEHRGRESFTPAGAMCATRPGFGPGTPYYADVPDALRAGLLQLDFERDSAGALDAVLAAARPRDALTLWHLLSRLSKYDRGRVFDRLASISAPPEGVTRDGIAGGDRDMLERWRDQLGLGYPSWGRKWFRW